MDKVLESCFQLLSLFYLTIGRNNEAPAAVALTSTVKRLLDHLTESDLYSAKDLESINSTLTKLSDSISQAREEQNPEAQHPSYMLDLLAERVEGCQASLASLQKRLERIGEPLLVMHEKLISILRQISLANTKAKVGPAAAGALLGGLTGHASSRRARCRSCGSSCSRLASSAGTASSRQKTARSRAAGPRCASCTSGASSGPTWCWSGMAATRAMSAPPADGPCSKSQVADQWRPTYDALVGIRNDLEKLSLTQAWSLRETDLYDFQRQLDKIDENRQGGNFYDDKGRPADLWMQRTMLYLIRRSYAYIYSFMLASEPVSEALLPIYNQLQTLKRCLIEVRKNGGVSSVRELYPYSMKVRRQRQRAADGSD